MPETNFNGRNTRTARNVRRSKELLVLMLTVAKLKNKTSRAKRVEDETIEPRDYDNEIHRIPRTP